MSYSRFSSGSDVYLFHHVDGYITCCGCSLMAKYKGNADPRLFSRTAALEHLDRHEAAGHAVPERARERLLEEIAELSDTARLGQRKVKQRKRVRVMKGLRRPRRIKPLNQNSWHRYMKWSRITSWKQITDYKEQP